MSHSRADTRRGNRKATANGDSRVEIQKANTTVPDTRADKNTDENRRARVVHFEFRSSNLRSWRPVGPPTGLPLNSCQADARMETCFIVNGYHIEGDEANLSSLEANINNIVVFTIYLFIARFKHETKPKVSLAHGREITSINSSTSGMEELVMMDYISYDPMKYVLVEANNAALRGAIKQCFLSPE
ncbi:hypothetical protein HOY80DRAFT_1060474 [Tuber brumale]|nr:hypothetical protein HOY80DRAFT_1060474 [Tuber brumale]